MSSTPMIEVYDLHRSLPIGGRELAVLRSLSFTIAPGEWVALTGPSGSGKSTLLGLLAGIDRPTRGAVQIDGIELNALSEAKLARLRNEKIGIIFQAFYLIQSMNALENVAAPLYIGPQRRQAHKLAEAMLWQVGLGNRLDHLPNQLSGGEQQRVAIARALVTGPRILLADEPTGNLDSAASAQVLALIREMRAALNLTVVMVTHDAQVARYADRQLHLIDGQLVNGDSSQPVYPAVASGPVVTAFGQEQP
ncbi:MAG TPA: ABC transporter ATP-binding protein [Anaerolineaceae bacterium]|nr:ABC transporter ATP-binding protein [Anaerolineaceae bacterium]